MGDLVADIFERVPAHAASLTLGNGGLRDLFDQVCHGHLDVELDRVCYRMELRVNHRVGKVHESNYHDLRRDQSRDIRDTISLDLGSSTYVHRY